MARAKMKGVRDDDIDSCLAAGAISPNRFVVKTTSGGGWAQNTTSGGRVDGVARLGAASGAIFARYRGGIQIVEAGAAVAEGDLVMSDTVGRAVTRTSTNFIAGVAQHAVTAAGQLLEVELTETFG